MAHPVVINEICSQDVPIPCQIFAGGDVLSHADPTDHLGQIGRFFPDQEIRFGNLEFAADSQGGLVWMKPSAPMEEPAKLDASAPEASGIAF